MIECEEISAPLNGGMEGSDARLLGSQCSLTCAVGYKLIGADTRTCMKNKRWDNDQALCVCK